MHLVWRTARGAEGTEFLQADLFGPYRATIGPDSRHRAWWWAVYHSRDEHEPVTEGFAYDERDAKTAVYDWVRPRAPRSLSRRLRSLVHRR